MFKNTLIIISLIFASAILYAKDYNFNKTISRQVLENYLDKAVTAQSILGLDNDKVYKELSEAMIYTGAKFIGRSFYVWGDEDEGLDPKNLALVEKRIKEYHQQKPDTIFQACVFEGTSIRMNKFKIPRWTFEALGFPYEDRYFDYEKTLFKDGRYLNQWGKNCSVPDINRKETKLYFMYLIGTYVNMGFESIHLGQVNLIGEDDYPKWDAWSDFLAKARIYANKKARRNILLFDAHTPKFGMVKDGVSLLDFNSFPVRLKAVKGEPYKAIFEVGYTDALYCKSLGCKTPSGWSCDSLPYLVEFDNFGRSDHMGKYNPHSFYIWGFDDITWFYLLTKENKIKFLDYAYDWLDKTDKNAHLQLVFRREVNYLPGRSRGNVLKSDLTEKEAMAKKIDLSFDFLEETKAYLDKFDK